MKESRTKSGWTVQERLNVFGVIMLRIYRVWACGLGETRLVTPEEFDQLIRRTQ